MLGLFQRRRGIKSLDSSADSVGPRIPVWAKDSTIPDEMRDEWIQNGLIVLHCLFDSHRVDEYNATVAKGRSQIDDGKDQYGYGDRVGQLHQKYNGPISPAVISGRSLTVKTWSQLIRSLRSCE